MPGCTGYYDSYGIEFDCGYHTILSCDECKYGVGKKDPEAWTNAFTEDRKDHINELRRKRLKNKEI